MRRGVAVSAVSLVAVAIAGGAVWAGFALSSGKTAVATAAAPSTSATTPPSSPVAATSQAEAAPSSTAALASTAGPSPTPAVAVCDPAKLQLTNPWQLSGGMGSETVAIVIRNAGSQPCSLTGWPTISTVAMRTKVQYATSTAAGFVVPLTRVLLQPGGTGSVALNLFGRPGTTYSQACFAIGSWAVTLPGSRQSTIVPWPKYQGACPGGTVIVSPVYTGNALVIGFEPPDTSSIPLLGPFDSPPTVP